MSIQDLGSIGGFVAAIATLATLIYLAVQIRANTASVRESNARVHTDRMLGHSRLIAADKELAGVFRRGSKDIDQLTDAERWQFGTYLWSLFIDFQDEYHASKRTRPDDFHWEFQQKNLLYYLSKPGIRKWWENLEMSLDPEFIEFANKQLQKEEKASRNDA